VSPAGETVVPDVLEAGAAVVFCGINPGRVSAAAGAPFANALVPYDRSAYFPSTKSHPVS
jgi:hypothetical protein